MEKIIKLSKRHFNELVQIDLEAQHQMESTLKLKDFKKILTERFKSKEEIFYGYKIDSELVGYITLKPTFPSHKTCELYWLTVKNKYQGKKIGSKLVSFIEKIAKKMKFRGIYLYTNKTMKKTRKFYEKNKFKLINEFPNYYNFEKNNTAVLYGKKLK